MILLIDKFSYENMTNKTSIVKCFFIAFTKKTLVQDQQRWQNIELNSLCEIEK
jgi:hypothetical protein